MAHQTGSVVNPVDLLQKLSVFIAANGWILDHNAVDGTGWRVHAHRGAVYINLRAAINETTAAGRFEADYIDAGVSGILLYGGDGYSGVSDWRSQSGAPKLAGAPAMTVGAGAILPPGASSAYHFFSIDGGNSIVVVVEKRASLFTNFGWGTSLHKVGSWAGGAYFFGGNGSHYLGYTANNVAYPGRGSSAVPPMSFADGSVGTLHCGFVRADVDAFTGKWICIGPGTTTDSGYTGKAAASTCAHKDWPLSWAPTTISARLTNALSGQSLLQPIHILARRDAGGSSFIGRVPGVFLTNACAKGFAAGGTYTWGSESYKVFPGPAAAGIYGPITSNGFAVKMD